MNKYFEIFLKFNNYKYQFKLPKEIVVIDYFLQNHNLKIASTDDDEFLNFIKHQTNLYKIKNQKVLQYVLFKLYEKNIKINFSLLKKLIENPYTNQSLFKTISFIFKEQYPNEYSDFAYKMLKNIKEKSNQKILSILYNFFSLPINEKSLEIFYQFITESNISVLSILYYAIKNNNSLNKPIINKIFQWYIQNEDLIPHEAKIILIELFTKLENLNLLFDFYNKYPSLKLIILSLIAKSPQKEALDFLLQSLDEIDDINIKFLICKNLNSAHQQTLENYFEKDPTNENFILSLAALRSTKHFDKIKELFKNNDDIFFKEIILIYFREIKNKSIIPILLKELDSNNIFYFENILNTLSELKDSRATLKLLKLLTPSNKKLNNIIGLTLAKIGDPLAIEKIIEYYKNDFIDEDVFIKILLQYSHQYFLDYLIDLLFDDNEKIRVVAIKVAKNLVQYIDYNVFLKLLEDKNNFVRATSALCLGLKGVKQSTINQKIIRLLKDYSYDVVINATKAITLLRIKEAIPIIWETLDYGDELTILVKLNALEELGSPINEEKLLNLLKLNNPKINNKVMQMIKI